jgi:hypothetical protein
LKADKSTDELKWQGKRGKRIGRLKRRKKRKGKMVPVSTS